MKKIRFSLIVKTAFMIFFAFAVVLGNEIRLGVKRYINNTLQTEASNNARNLEKLEKSYIESNYQLIEKKSLFDNKQFMEEYTTFLDDSTKITCLTDSEGNIVNITRPGYESPILHLIEDKDNNSNPIYFEISSLNDFALQRIESYLALHTNSDIQVEITFTGYTQDQDEISMFSDIDIKELSLDGNGIYINNDLSGETKTYSGYLGYFEDLDYQYMFSVENSLSNIYYDGLNGEIVKEKVIIYDYASMRKCLEEQIKNNFHSFINNGTMFMSTSYSDYYLLDLIEDDHLSYSTTMCKFIDWISIKNETADNTYELERKATEGYCFVVQKYNHLQLDATKDFIIDNISTYSVAVVLIGLICILLAYFIVKPIRQIEKAAKAISNKDFHYPLTYKYNDEIGSLSKSINSMSEELEKTINNLHLEIDHVKQLEDIRKEFVSNFTHEIKTPLGIINGFSELIEIEEDEEKRNEYIDVIQQETKKINKLVLAMLDLSKLQSQSIALDISDIDMIDLCDNIIEKLQYKINQNNIIVERDYYPCHIQADYLKIEMVITNLITNALKNTQDGHICITINEKGFYIENEGSHIDDPDKIWLAFYKGDKSRNNEGTGLGLSICKAILDLHGYKYDAVNTARGVLFYFEFK